MSIQFANRVIHESWDHPILYEARATGDKELFKNTLKAITRSNGTIDTSDYERIERDTTNNLLTVEGKKYALDRITGVVTATPSWYLALFESNSTPTNAWDGNFGAVSGGTCTEFISYDEATRQQCVFDAATDSVGRASTTNGTRAVITISAGVEDANIYGLCVTNNSTKQYSASAAKLLTALRFSTYKLYNEAEIKSIGYELYIP